MTYVFSDERLEGCEVRCHGTPLFEVCLRGKVVTTFESWEKADGTISHDFAARRAADYFDRCSKVSLREAQENFEQVPPASPEDAAAIFNAPPSSLHSSRVIDRMIEREKMERDPEKKRMLRHNILQMMKQEEPVAEAVVCSLLDFN